MMLHNNYNINIAIFYGLGMMLHNNNNISIAIFYGLRMMLHNNNNNTSIANIMDCA